MGTLVLSEADRKKWDAPEVIEFRPGRYGIRAVGAMEKATGYTLRWVENQLAGVPVIDKETGEVETRTVVADDGTETVKPRLRTDPEAIAAWVWLMLWSSGIKPDWKTFDVDPVGLVIDFSDGEGDDEGKAETPTTGSASTPNT